MILFKRATTGILFIAFLFTAHLVAAQEDSDQEEDAPVFMTVENMPKLHGSVDSLNEQITYPPKAQKTGVQGRIIVQFVVGKDGSVENPKIIRGIGAGCDKEALRVIKKAKFTPAQKQGQRVKAKQLLPIQCEPQKSP